jgi:hypothetical protein
LTYDGGHFLQAKAANPLAELQALVAAGQEARAKEQAEALARAEVRDRGVH